MALTPEAKAVFLRNVGVYERELPQLIKEHHEGAYAVISNSKLLVVRSSRDAAYSFAYNELGESPFLVKQILESDLEHMAPSGVCPS